MAVPCGKWFLIRSEALHSSSAVQNAIGSSTFEISGGKVSQLRSGGKQAHGLCSIIALIITLAFQNLLQSPRAKSLYWNGGETHFGCSHIQLMERSVGE